MLACVSPKSNRGHLLLTQRWYNSVSREVTRVSGLDCMYTLLQFYEMDFFIVICEEMFGARRQHGNIARQTCSFHFVAAKHRVLNNSYSFIFFENSVWKTTNSKILNQAAVIH